MTDVVLISVTREELAGIVSDAVKTALQQAAIEPPEILTSKQAGALIGLSPITMERHAHAKRCPAFRHGRQWRFRRTEVIAWNAKERACP